MFSGARSFNGDISKWDVSSVSSMPGMFWGATSFNCDISKWDVSRVTNMDHMFWGAVSFKHNLCGPAWFYSKASKTNMFPNSQVCRRYVTQRPLTERELKIVREPITKPVSTCPRCGTFDKSGRVSCCAPGGAWYKNCGAVNNKNVGHRWSEGAAACKRKSDTM